MEEHREFSPYTFQKYSQGCKSSFAASSGIIIEEPLYRPNQDIFKPAYHFLFPQSLWVWRRTLSLTRLSSGSSSTLQKPTKKHCLLSSFSEKQSNASSYGTSHLCVISRLFHWQTHHGSTFASNINKIYALSVSSRFIGSLNTCFSSVILFSLAFFFHYELTLNYFLFRLKRATFNLVPLLIVSWDALLRMALTAAFFPIKSHI